MTALASISSTPIEGGLLASTDVAAVLGEIWTQDDEVLIRRCLRCSFRERI